MTDLSLTLSSLLRADLTTAMKNARTLIIGAVMGLLVIVSTRSEQDAHQLGGHAYAVGVATAVTLMTTAILGYAMSMGRDRESSVLRRLQVTPAPGWAIIASRMVAQASSALMLVLTVLGLLGEAGALGGTWAAIAPCAPLGAIMTLYARVLDPAAWSSRDTVSMLTSAGYIVILAAAGIRWFRWEAR